MPSLAQRRRDDFFALLFFDELFFADDFFFGTFAPALRASDSPIAIACLRLVTFFPLRPLFSVPLFFSRMTRATFFCAFELYFLPPDDFLCEELFFVAIQPSPFCCMGSSAGYGGCARKFGIVRDSLRDESLVRYRFRRQNVFDVDPLRRIVPRVARHAVGVAFAAVTRIA